jgi:hypothetical protein
LCLGKSDSRRRVKNASRQLRRKIAVFGRVRGVSLPKYQELARTVIHIFVAALHFTGNHVGLELGFKVGYCIFHARGVGGFW